MGFQPINTQRLARFNSALASQVLDIYEQGLEDRIAEERSRKPSQTFAPSSMRCERISWFRLRGVEPDKLETADTGLDFTAKMGTACHEMIQEALSRTEYWVDVQSYVESLPTKHVYSLERNGYETRITMQNPPIRFSCDGILKIDGKYILIEIKSCDHSSFIDLTDPKSQHIYQAKGYGTLLHIDKVIFIYIDRQYGDVKSYEIKITLEDSTQIVNMFSRVQKLADARIVPEPLPKGDSWCNRSMCNYFDKCSQYGR